MTKFSNNVRILNKRISNFNTAAPIELVNMVETLLNELTIDDLFELVRLGMNDNLSFDIKYNSNMRGWDSNPSIQSFCKSVLAWYESNQQIISKDINAFCDSIIPDACKKISEIEGVKFGTIRIIKADSKYQHQNGVSNKNIMEVQLSITMDDQCYDTDNGSNS